MENEVKVIDKRPEFKQDENLPEAQSPNAVVMLALQKNYDPELIRQLMDLAERAEKNQARRDFYQAFANFKAEAPPVTKDKYNKYFESHYTSLGNLLDTYNPVLGKHGLSVSFPTPEQSGNEMTIICRLSHRSGHFEDYKIKGPIDQAAVGKASGQKSRNAIQDIKSTLTYYRSATCEMALGVAGTEASFDDDGNLSNAGQEFITPEQLTELKNLLDTSDLLPGAFLKSFKIETLSELPAKKFTNAKSTLAKRQK
jgi:ERF superfamily